MIAQHFSHFQRVIGLEKVLLRFYTPKSVVNALLSSFPYILPILPTWSILRFAIPKLDFGIMECKLDVDTIDTSISRDSVPLLNAK